MKVDLFGGYYGGPEGSTCCKTLTEARGNKKKKQWKYFQRSLKSGERV